MAVIEQDQGKVLAKRAENGILWVLLNRPQALNAFNREMMEALIQALKEMEKDPALRVMVIGGLGKAFCVGQDLKEHLSLKPSFLEDLRQRYNPLVLRIRRLEKPVISMVHGPAAGAGMSLALACDFRVCSEEASFHTSFIKIGLAPDSGNLFFLAKYIGWGRALELEMTGRPLQARQALEWGLAHRVVPVKEVEEETKNLALELVSSPSKALGLVKRMFNRSLFAKGLESQLEMEACLQEIAGRTRDHHEGIQAFMEKRKAKFQ